MIQLVQEILLGRVSVPPVTEDDLAREFQASKAEHREPRKYSIKHLYFSSERLAQAMSLKTRIAQEDLGFQITKQFSEPFLQGYQFSEQSPAQLAKYFGTEFVDNFEQLAPSVGAWVGPVKSTYGFHLVWVDAIEDSKQLSLDDVREGLQRDLLSERQRQS